VSGPRADWFLDRCGPSADDGCLFFDVQQNLTLAEVAVRRWDCFNSFFAVTISTVTDAADDVAKSLLLQAMTSLTPALSFADKVGPTRHPARSPK
jgi:hypothetical protein